MDGSEHLPLEGLVDDMLRDASAAIRQEIEASPAATDVLELTDGRLVGVLGASRVWSFAVDDDIAPAPETPGELRVDGGDPIPVQALAVGDASIVLAVADDIGASVLAAELSLTVGFVYETLLERLDEFVGSQVTDESLLNQLVMPETFEGGEQDGADGQGYPDPDEDQRRAASKAVAPGLRFTWGPPGTGKTKVLAMAAAEAAQRGDSVLVLAHANAAVDVAASRIADELVDDALLAEGKVVRVGTPQNADLLSRAEILPDRLAEARLPESSGRLDELTGRRRGLSNEMRSVVDVRTREQLADELNDVRAELREIRAELGSVSADIVDGAAVVATTLSRFAIDDKLWARDFDVVIVDEASMAPLPFILALSLRSPLTLSIFGDFRQLPPIAVSNEDAALRWFARDAFEFGGVVEAHELGRSDSRLSVLRTQFRMGEQICETVNRLAYGGHLRTHFGARDRAIRLAELEPSPGVEVVIVDTTKLGSVCLVDHEPDSFSRLSPLAGVLVATVAERIAASGCESVGLISPYRAQTRWTKTLVSTICEANAATIHRFQGSECDAVIFDLTDGPDFSGPSRLTGGDAETAMRLFNVAVSRARGKLIVLADLDFVETRFPLRSPFPALVECMLGAGGEVVTATDLVDDLTLRGDGGSLTWRVCWATAALNAVAAAGAEARVELNLPDPCFSWERLDEVLSHVPDRDLVRVRCSAATARSLTQSRIDIRLLLAGSMPWAVVDESTLVLGSNVVDGPAAVVHGRSIVAAFRRAVSPLGGE